MEIERKFLVKEIPNNILKQSNITQGYLCYDPEIRIRNIDDKKYFLTIKTSDCSMIRDEHEIEIQKEIYSSLFKETKAIINKTRSYVNLSTGLTAEIDSYDDGLVVVEVEFKTKENADDFIPPSWFGEEVTYNKAYKNVNLAHKVCRIFKED